MYVAPLYFMILFHYLLWIWKIISKYAITLYSNWNFSSFFFRKKYEFLFAPLLLKVFVNVFFYDERITFVMRHTKYVIYSWYYQLVSFFETLVIIPNTYISWVNKMSPWHLCSWNWWEVSWYLLNFFHSQFLCYLSGLKNSWLCEVGD